MTAVLVALPLTAAQQGADLRVSDLDVRTLDGDALANPGIDELVEVVVELTNVGDNETGNTDPVQVTLRITGPTGTETKTRNAMPNRAANGTTEVVFEWRPSEHGEHTLNASLPNGASGIRTVSVHDTATKAGTLVDRFLDYWFVVVGFAASVVLFAVVGSVRRKP